MKNNSMQESEGFVLSKPLEKADFKAFENSMTLRDLEINLPRILFISSYPPRECGIATYTSDLIHAIQQKFSKTFAINVCALETKCQAYTYPEEVKYILQTSEWSQYESLAKKINADPKIKIVFIEHEFGLFSGELGEYLLWFLTLLTKPIITTFHTVLPRPEPERRKLVRAIAQLSEQVVVMTQNSAEILKGAYNIDEKKLTLIPHGTHLVSSFEPINFPQHKKFEGKLILSTFGLLGPGKSLETALDALPAIIQKFPNVLYLIIGKTHPEVAKNEGENYRRFLMEKVAENGLESNVMFINSYLSLQDLMGYLQRTDVYLFTSKDPFQAVSGTFSYAMACGCPIISTPIPHAIEMLDGGGRIFDFGNSKKLATAAIELLSNSRLLHEMRLNAFHNISPSAWQNTALSHIKLMQNADHTNSLEPVYKFPPISLSHIRRMTTAKGMIQFANISNPDIESGYTLDDNARALIAVTQHYALTGDSEDLTLIKTYLDFIIFCQSPDGSFLNYVDKDYNFFAKNKNENLQDSNGRAIWALGEFISFHNILDADLIMQAQLCLDLAMVQIYEFSSPRAMAFAIKGLHHYHKEKNNIEAKRLIILLADNLVSKYRGVSEGEWQWYEEYLTYANSLLPEAMLLAWKTTNIEIYKSIALSSFDFLLDIIFIDGQIKVVSNHGWHLKGQTSNNFGEQPIDVAYTILALGVFYGHFLDLEYLNKMNIAFDWFLGANHRNQIIYNPATGGCYDGLEETHINLNQGAESTVSYLLSRLEVAQFEEEFEEIRNHVFMPALQVLMA